MSSVNSCIPCSLLLNEERCSLYASCIGKQKPEMHAMSYPPASAVCPGLAKGTMQPDNNAKSSTSEIEY
jgi:hypothetical protein